MKLKPKTLRNQGTKLGTENWQIPVAWREQTQHMGVVMEGKHRA